MWPFATDAFALPPGGGDGAGGMIIQFAPFILIFIIFWFLIIRPQQKKAKAHKELVANLKKGDEVYTDSGIRGVIQKVDTDLISMEIAPKVTIRLLRARVSGLAREPKAKEPKAKAAKES